MIKRTLTTFFNDKLTPDVKLIYCLLALNVFIGVILMITNQVTHDYDGTIYFTTSWQLVIMPLILLSGAVLYFHDILAPRVSLTLLIFSLYALSLCVGLILTQGIETTPFTTVDMYLARADHLLGFHQTALLPIVYKHHWLVKLFMWGYDSIIPELNVLPLLLALLLQERATKVFLIAMLVSYPVGTLLFYFFPTTAPASIMHSSYFTFQEHDTYIKFYEMHHHMNLTTDEGGLVAFPSFHVIWGVLLIYLAHSKKWLFYAVLLWNMVMIGSTLALGWHYLIDVISGITIATVAIMIGEYAYLMTRKCGGLDLDEGVPEGGAGGGEPS